MLKFSQWLKRKPKVIGPFKAKKYDPKTRELELEGHEIVTLSKDIKETPKVGFNYAFELEGNTATKLIILVVDIVVLFEEQILLVQRGKEPFKDYWCVPGGHVDPGETFMEAALRELKEETDVDIDFLTYVGVFNEKNRDPRAEYVYSYVHKIQLKEKPNIKAGDDAKNAQWFPINNLPKLAFDHDKIIKKSLNK